MSRYLKAWSLSSSLLMFSLQISYHKLFDDLSNLITVITSSLSQSLVEQTSFPHLLFIAIVLITIIIIIITSTVLSYDNCCFHIDNIIFPPDHHSIHDHLRDQAININEFTSLCTNLIRSELGIPYKVTLNVCFLESSLYSEPYFVWILFILFIYENNTFLNNYFQQIRK